MNKITPAVILLLGKSPDEEKIDESFKGVVEKMEAHSMMAQVNELEAAYDTWLDYPVGEKKERDTPFHYHVVDFLLNFHIKE